MRRSGRAKGRPGQGRGSRKPLPCDLDRGPGGETMRSNKALYASTALGIAMLAAGLPATVRGQQNPAPQPSAGAAAAVQIDGDDIGGVVSSRFGPEAGVWVIAETTELGTRFAKMVVTDDLGRYVLPDLPKATYTVWVR